MEVTQINSVIWPVRRSNRLLPLLEHPKLRYGLPCYMLWFLLTEIMCCLLQTANLFGAQFNSTEVGKLWIHTHVSLYSCIFKNVMAPGRLCSSNILHRDIFLRRVIQSPRLVLMLFFALSSFFSFPSFLLSFLPTFPPSFVSFLPPSFLPSFHFIFTHFTERWFRLSTEWDKLSSFAR